MRPLCLIAPAALFLAACTLGAPPGFSSGDSWSFPLVTPLEGGPLLVPVMIHDHGPYLFEIDPDAPVSALDSALVSELGLHSTLGPEVVDESDKAINTTMAEVLHIKFGTLAINATRLFLVTPIGTYNSGGHQVRGVLGRDIFSDSLAMGFDRKAGMGWVTTQKGFHPPADATLITTRVEKNRVSSGIKPVSKRLTHAIIDGKELTVHVDLGAVESQLRENLWGKAGLTPVQVKRSLVDEVGSRRDVTSAGVASTVEIGGIKAENVVFVPYVDERWDELEFDGTVGLGVFDGHAVWANGNDGKFYLTPEADTSAKTRIERWGSSELDGCAVPGCTTVDLLVPEGSGEVGAPGAEAEGRPVLSASRSDDVAGIALEVMIEARTADDHPTDLPKFVVIFPAGETQVSLAVDAAYVGTKFWVVDVSPFPRACPRAGACVYQLAENH